MSSILHWDFQQPPPTLTDQSGNTNTGTVSGATRVSAPDGINYVYTFNTDGDKIVTPTSSSLSAVTSYSVEIWFSLSGTTGTYIASHGSGTLGIGQRGWHLSSSGGSSIAFKAYSGGGATAAVLSSVVENKTWTYIVATISNTASSIVLYKNGTYVTSSTFGVFRPEINYPCSVGKHPRYNIYFKGSIGLLKLHNNALTAETILSNYQNSIATYTYAQDEKQNILVPMALFNNSIEVF